MAPGLHRLVRVRFFGSSTALALALIAAPLCASAETAPAGEAQPAIDLRALVGVGSGVGADAWLPGGRARLDLDVVGYFFDGLDFGGVAVVVPFAGTRRAFSGVRAGWQLEYLPAEPGWRGSQFAHAPDVSYVGRIESAAGSAFEAQIGVEAVIRAEAAQCCDNAALETLSFGVRIALLGELALTPAWALCGQASLRTGDHIFEVKVLPTLSGGVRYRF